MRNEQTSKISDFVAELDRESSAATATLKMSFEALESQLIDSFFNKTSDLLFGERNKSGLENSAAVLTTENPLFQDTFFHPELIGDEEPCKLVLHAGIGGSRLRVWDVIILGPNVVFLLFLLYQQPKTRSRLLGAQSPVLKTLHRHVVTLSFTAALRSFLAIILNLSNPVHDVTNSIIWQFSAFIFLSLELEIGVLVVTENKIRDYRKCLTSACCLVSLVVTGLQLYYEVVTPYYGLTVLSSGYQLWGAGGPVFSAALAGSLAAFSLLLLVLSSGLSSGLHVQPTSKRSVVYLTSLAASHSISCLGSTLLSHHVNCGLCLNSLTTFLHYTAYPLLVYVCFLTSKLPNVLKKYQFSYSAQHDEEDKENENVTDCSSIQTFILEKENSE